MQKFTSKAGFKNIILTVFLTMLKFLIIFSQKNHKTQFWVL